MLSFENGFCISENAPTVKIDSEYDYLPVDYCFNTRVEVFPGFKRITVCNKGKWSLIDKAKAKAKPEEAYSTWLDELEEWELDFSVDGGGSHLDPDMRARRKAFDLIALTRWDWFVTLTLDKSKIDRGDVKAFSSKLKRYLDNLVQRQGIGYVLVPELHQDGKYHAHALIRGDLQVVDSGTVTWIGNKRPVKPETARKRGVPQDVWMTVYNVPSWKLGFTTAIRTYGSGEELARYVGKYITKGSRKIFGKRYWHSKNIRQVPDVVLTHTEWHLAQGVLYTNSYTFDEYKIYTEKT